MSIPLAALPALNAVLNSTSAVLLITGRILIARRRITAHRAVMITALGTSTLFLVSYLYYHAHVGTTHFPALGWIRTVYLLILGTHTVLAALTLPLVIVTLSRALRNRFDRHRAIARWTFPIWLYVSITGVLIYFMLYHWFAPVGL